MEPIKILSLGAGVQSSTLALMAARGAMETPSCAIFADTGHEPRHTRTLDPATGQWIEGGVYGWLDWLEAQVPFPIHRVSAGSLIEGSLAVRRSKKSGKLYSKNMIPAFMLKPDGKKGLMGRKCTTDYKIIPIQRKVREILGVKRAPRDVRVIMQIGISTDEAIRMKPSRVPHIRHEWPLIDPLNMSRADCLEWLEANGFPIAPRSACTFCPFHGDKEWLMLKNESPQDFNEAAQFEKDLQVAISRQEVLTGVPFLHDACVPLGDVELSDAEGYQQVSQFGNECEGLCGV